VCPGMCDRLTFEAADLSIHEPGPSTSEALYTVPEFA